MGNPGKPEEDLGIAVLAALSISGLHAAIVPSYFTMVTFASQPEARSRAMDGLWISLVASSLASVAIYGVWKNLPSAITAEATALALFGIGVYAINKQPPKGIPPIEKQQTTEVAVQGSRPPRVMGSQVVYSR
jgi:hypothetical protein